MNSSVPHNSGLVAALAMGGALLLAMAGCSERPELYCNATEACTAGHAYCDIEGICAASDGIANTCIPEPCWDAGLPPMIDADLSGPPDARPPDAGPDGDGCVPSLTCNDVLCGSIPDNGCSTPVDCGSCSYLQKARIQVVGASDEPGDSVAIDGARMVFGAPTDDSSGTRTGSALIYERSGSGTWVQHALFYPADAATNDRFGDAVAIDGDYVVVGAPWDDDKGSTSGSAYILKRNANGTWSQDEKLVAPDGAQDDQFGLSVAIDGDYVVVGSPYDDSWIGGAYVWRRNGADWDYVDKLAPSDGEVGDFAGWDVAISGDTILVSAHGDNPLAGNSGSVYVFERQANNTWTETTTFYPLAGQATDEFGTSVAIDGDLAAIGTSNGEAGYVFQRAGNGSWSELEKLQTGQASSTLFARSVGVSGRAVIAARGPDASGSAFVYTDPLGQDSWARQKVLSADAASGHMFGSSVDISGRYAVVGAPGAGTVYVFEIP